MVESPDVEPMDTGPIDTKGQLQNTIRLCMLKMGSSSKRVRQRRKQSITSKSQETNSKIRPSGTWDKKNRIETIK